MLFSTVNVDVLVIMQASDFKPVYGDILQQIPKQRFSDSRQKQQFTSGKIFYKIYRYVLLNILTSISARDAMIFTILEQMRADKATIRAASSNGRQLKMVIHWCCQKMSCFSSHGLQTLKLMSCLLSLCITYIKCI